VYSLSYLAGFSEDARAAATIPLRKAAAAPTTEEGTPMATTTASKAGLEAQALAEHLRDGALLNFDEGESLCSALDWSWPDAGATVTPEELACWEAATEMLYMSATGPRANQHGVEHPAEFDTVRRLLAELVSQINTVRHAEYGVDGEGARFRDFAPIHRTSDALRDALAEWETSLLGSSRASLEVQ
jgi:hypothetical protein